MYFNLNDMRNFLNRLLILTTVIALFSTCKKKEFCCGFGESIHMTATRNLRYWSATDFNIALKGDTLTVTGKVDNETLVMKMKYTGTGKYQLPANQMLYSLTTPDANRNIAYVPDPTKENDIIVGPEGGVGDIFVGGFTLNLVIASPYDAFENPYSPAVQFTLGDFRVQIDK